MTNYHTSLIVWEGETPRRKLTLREAQAIYPNKNPATLDRDIRRAWARLDNKADVPNAFVKEPVLHRAEDIDWIKGSVSLDKEVSKFVILFDLHYPYQVCQGQIEEFLQDFKPDILVYGGDQINGDPFNHWAMTVPREARNLPLPRPYYEAANRELFLPLRRAAKQAKIIAMIGNHDAWAYRAIDDMPFGEGYWEPELNIDGVDSWVHAKELINIGKLYIAHGDMVESLPAASQARGLIMKGYYRNLVIGHFHTYNVATAVSPIDTKDRHVVELSPCLTTFNPEYMRNRPHSWIQGFIYGYVEKGGNFSKHTTIISDGQFEAMGKWYTRRSNG